MLCLHQRENKQIFTQLVAYPMKNTAREIKQGLANLNPLKKKNDENLFY